MLFSICVWIYIYLSIYLSIYTYINAHAHTDIYIYICNYNYHYSITIIIFFYILYHLSSLSTVNDVAIIANSITFQSRYNPAGLKVNIKIITAAPVSLLRLAISNHEPIKLYHTSLIFSFVRAYMAADYYG